VGDISYRQDFAKNSVLEQRYNGAVIQPGVPIHLGAFVSLVLGSGVSESEFPVPNIIGMAFSEAKDYLEGLGLSILSVIAPGVSDTANAYIYRQNPGRFGGEGQMLRIRGGQTMDVWLQAEPVRVEVMEE